MGTTYESDTTVKIVCDDGEYAYEIGKDADGCVSVKYLQLKSECDIDFEEGMEGKLILTDTYCLGMAKDALLIAKGITEVANRMLKQE